MQLEKKMSAEQEIIIQKIEALRQSKVKIEERLSKARELLNSTPWDAERDKDVKDLEHQLAVIEFNLKTLREKLV